MIKRFITWFNYIFRNKINIKIKLLNENANFPIYANKTDSCMDIYCPEETVIPKKQTIHIPLGIAFEIPEGHEIQIRNRSSLGKKGLIVPNGLGTIDSGYRGEVGVLIHNSTNKDYTVKKLDRIAQFMVCKSPKINLIPTRELSISDRNTGGFGSTGV